MAINDCFLYFSVIINDDNDNYGKSQDSLPSLYQNDSSSSGAHSLEPDINPDEQEEKARLISQVLELQNTLDGLWMFYFIFKLFSNQIHFFFFFLNNLDLSQRVDSVKEENLKLRSENQVLGQYIENLMSASSVFQSTNAQSKKKWSSDKQKKTIFVLFY